MSIRHILKGPLHASNNITVNGWIRSVRKQKNVAFAAVGDGSTLDSLQAVFQPKHAQELSHGAAVTLSGAWVPSPGKGQSNELQVSEAKVLGENDPEKNPLQPKYQSQDFLRTIPHLRPRQASNALLLRLRSRVIASLTNFFNEHDFVQTHTPIITCSDCEGAGEVFTVSSNASKDSEQKTNKDGQVEHFFKTPKYLTVSSQLHLEALAQSMGKVWTLSPTFRAEKSDTPRHLAEFYMLEAEICFVDDVSAVMDLVENMLRYIANDVYHKSDLVAELKRRIATHETDHHEGGPDSSGLEARWQGILRAKWPRITYDQAITILDEAARKSMAFEQPPAHQNGLRAEHERFIANHVGKGTPVFVTDYPKEQKPFYMPPSKPLEASDGSRVETVACFDLLVPDLCELAGGSMREHRPHELLEAMQRSGMIKDSDAGQGSDRDINANLEWYQDLRRYGSVPHGGFGLGFDRLLCYLSGVPNVRDIVIFPRYYGRCDC